MIKTKGHQLMTELCAHRSFNSGEKRSNRLNQNPKKCVCTWRANSMNAVRVLRLWLRFDYHIWNKLSSKLTFRNFDFICRPRQARPCYVKRLEKREKKRQSISPCYMGTEIFAIFSLKWRCQAIQVTRAFVVGVRFLLWFIANCADMHIWK